MYLKNSIHKLKENMQFKTQVIWLSHLYKILKKTPFKRGFDLDMYIDNNMPQFLSRLQTYADLKKIAIFATNGKRTTTDIFNQILEADNKTYFTNISKDGNINPVFTSLTLDLAKEIEKYGFENKKDYYSMAFNEFELEPYFNSMKFDKLLLHNVFVDQKDFATLKRKRRYIQEAIMLNSRLDLIINADEPLFFKIDEIKNDTAANKKREKFYYGFNEITFFENDEKLVQKNDMLICPICGCKLEYKRRFYSHLGSYYCECGFKRPPLDVKANARVYRDYCFLDVFYKEDKLSFKVPLGGVYNAYNALGAICLALNLNIHRKTVISAFDRFIHLKAHDEIVKFKNKNIKIKIAKNPVSLSEAIKELKGSENTKLVLCFNDDKKDGTDTSWIWDSNFEAIRNFENKIYVCSRRFDDMALKLKYSGVNPSLIVMDSLVKNAINCCYYDLEEKESMLIVSVPSLLNEIYNVLKR